MTVSKRAGERVSEWVRERVSEWVREREREREGVICYVSQCQCHSSGIYSLRYPFVSDTFAAFLTNDFH